MFFATFLGFFLSTAQLEIGRQMLTVEIVDTPLTRDKGLMHRDSLPANHGMLFVYDAPEMLAFWMKNTKIPLSIGFFDHEKKLLQIENMDPPQSKTAPLFLYKSRYPCRYALEVPQGWFSEHHIAPGAKFTLHDVSQ